MPHRPLTSLVRHRGRHGVSRSAAHEPLTNHAVDRFDGLGRSLAATAPRRLVLRVVAGAVGAGLLGWRGAGVADAHNPLKKCEKIKKRSARKRCIKRGKAHNATHRKRKPNASCLAQTTLGSGFASPYRYAQTFTEPNGGKLTTARIMLSKEPATTGTLHLAVNTVDAATGLPQNNTIASSAPVLATAVGTSEALVTFSFPVPPLLVAKRKYALVLSRSSAPGLFVVYVVEPGTCKGGTLYFSPSLTGAFTVGDPPLDMMFETDVNR